MRKIWREVTRKNQKTDEPAFAEAMAWQAADYAGVTDRSDRKKDKQTNEAKRTILILRIYTD
jgi:hypothetical protein